MLCVYRYDKDGRTCSGDFEHITPDKELYQEYYLKKEGRFFEIYSMIIFVVVPLASITLILSLKYFYFKKQKK